MRDESSSSPVRRCCRRVSGAAVAAFLLSTAPLYAQSKSITLAWDANTESDVAGYVVAYGTQSRHYVATIDVGNVTSRRLTVTIGQRYYFAVKAYNTSGQQSPYSEEVHYGGSAPSLARPPNPMSIAGRAATLQLAGADVDGDVITYDASGLPAGLTVNPATGLITGAPAATGIFNITATASDLDGATSQTFTWFVTRGYTGDYGNDLAEISAADFNGDGFTDFFLYNPATGVWYKALNNRRGNFTYFSGQWSAGWRAVVLDLDGDHHSDVFVYNPTTGDWYRCVSTGDGTGDFAYVAGHWSAGWQIYPADLNGDGKGDLFLYQPTLGWWYQVVNDGTNFAYTFGQWSAGWAITPGDFNGDGKTDFFLSNPMSGEWYVATTLSPSGFSYGHGFWSTGWTFTPGDLNGDGKVDLFLYNPATGWWYEALSNGAGGFN